MTICGASHSQIRMNGFRLPAATSSTSVSSIATFTTGFTNGPWMTSKSRSSQSTAAPSARLIATPMPCGLTPNRTSSGRNCASMRAAILLAEDEVGTPSTTSWRRKITSSGSAKKSPEIFTSTARFTPSSSPPSSRSTTTSFPPGSLYSPCMPPV